MESEIGIDATYLFARICVDNPKGVAGANWNIGIPNWNRGGIHPSAGDFTRFNRPENGTYAMRKRQKALEREALRTAQDLATAGSRTAATWLAEVESGERPASLASLIAAEWRTAAPRLAAMIETMTDAEAETALRGPVRRLILERMAKDTGE